MKSLAFYSAQAAEMFGTSIYLNNEGKEVELTALVSDANSYKWADKVFLGEIESTNFVRRGVDGYWSFYEEAFDQAFDLQYEDESVMDCYEDDLDDYEPEYIEPYTDPFYSENDW